MYGCEVALGSDFSLSACFINVLSSFFFLEIWTCFRTHMQMRYCKVHIYFEEIRHLYASYSYIVQLYIALKLILNLFCEIFHSHWGSFGQAGPLICGTFIWVIRNITHLLAQLHIVARRSQKVDALLKAAIFFPQLHLSRAAS